MALRVRRCRPAPALLLVVTLLLRSAAAFYVPGVAPVEFAENEPIKVQAIKMTSTHTQLPYDYYSLPLCQPKNQKLVYKSENLGKRQCGW